MTKRRIGELATLSLLVAASTLVVAQTVPAGGADFSRFVAIGDGLTAGWTNGGVALQTDSLPALIYRQVFGSAVGFEQPLISEPGIPAQLELQGLRPALLVPKPGTGVPLNAALPRPYDNLGIPGATVVDVVNTVNDNGGFHDLVLRNPALGNTTALQQAVSLNPTFVSLWIGPNDALAAATAGDPSLLTPLPLFETNYGGILSALDQAGVAMVVANVPDVTSIPFVTTIPHVVVDPLTGDPVQSGGASVPLIGEDGVTPLTAADRVLLSAADLLARGCGIPLALGGLAGAPPNTEPLCPTGGLPGTVVLTSSELATIQQAVADYNACIRDFLNRTRVVCQQNQSVPTLGPFDVAFVDANAILRQIDEQGLNMAGVEYGSEFLVGGFFGYDGVHPTRFGYAYTANEFIAAINRRFGARIPMVDLFPYVFGAPSSGQRLPAWVAAGARLSTHSTHNLLVGLGALDAAFVWEAPTPGQPPGPETMRPRTRLAEGEPVRDDAPRSAPRRR